MSYTLIGESLALDRLPGIVRGHRDYSIGIHYLPETLKASYMYIYIPKEGEKGSKVDMLSRCQKADIQISIHSVELHDTDQMKVMRQSRARFQGDSFNFCQLEAANLDQEFVAHLFCRVTDLTNSEPSSSPDKPLVRRQTR